jgi:transposase-like protein
MQQESGLSIAAFCEFEGISQGSFYAWRRRLQQETPETTIRQADTGGDADEAPRLVPVRLVDDAQSAAVEVVSAKGLVLRVGDDAGTENVRRMLQLLQEIA